MAKTKQRVYGEQRLFLGNYETVLVKEESLRIAIGEYLDGGLVSAPFAESALGGSIIVFL